MATSAQTGRRPAASRGPTAGRNPPQPPPSREGPASSPSPHPPHPTARPAPGPHGSRASLAPAGISSSSPPVTMTPPPGDQSQAGEASGKVDYEELLAASAVASGSRRLLSTSALAHLDLADAWTSFQDSQGGGAFQNPYEGAPQLQDPLALDASALEATLQGAPWDLLLGLEASQDKHGRGGHQGVSLPEGERHQGDSLPRGGRQELRGVPWSDSTGAWWARPGMCFGAGSAPAQSCPASAPAPAAGQSFAASIPGEVALWATGAAAVPPEPRAIDLSQGGSSGTGTGASLREAPGSSLDDDLDLLLGPSGDGGRVAALRETGSSGAKAAAVVHSVASGESGLVVAGDVGRASDLATAVSQVPQAAVLPQGQGDDFDDWFDAVTA